MPKIITVRVTDYNNMLLSIIAGDPARANDRFGIIGGTLNTKTYEMKIKFARQYHQTSFYDVGKSMLPLIKKIKPNVIVLEENNEGKQAIIQWEKAGIKYVKGVTTVARLSQNKKDTQWPRMEKTHTALWFAQMVKKGKIQFPKKQSDHMKVLVDQISMITQQRTLNGSSTYKAINGRHDDLFSALLIFCHICKYYIIQKDE